MPLLDDLRYIFVGDPLSFLVLLALGVETCFFVWGKQYLQAWRAILAWYRSR